MADMETTTATMTVTGFEHHGPITVRERTHRDTMFTIPLLIDHEINKHIQELIAAGVNIDPLNVGEQVRYNAMWIAVARCAIVEPSDLVDRILESTDNKDFSAKIKNDKGEATSVGFFGQFASEYIDWMNGQSEEAQEKKSGRGSKATGKKSASSSETDTDSPQLTLAG